MNHLKLFLISLASIVLTCVTAQGSHRSCNKIFNDENQPFNRFGIGGNYPPESMIDVLRAEERAKLVEQGKEEELKDFRCRMTSNPRFCQSRSVGEALSSTVEEYLMTLPAGSVLVDMGAGHGTTIATAVYGTSFGHGHHADWARAATDASAKNLEPYNFLGITATDPEHMVIPEDGPNGRWKLMAGRLFEDIPNYEISKFVAGRKVVAFDMVGIFSYTPTPDIALHKFHDAFPPGSRLYGFDTQSLIQLESGEVIDYGKYAEMLGFKVTYGSPNYYGQRFAIYLENVAEPLKDIPVTLVAKYGDRPPVYFFQVRNEKRTAKQVEKLKKIAIEKYRLDSRFEWAK